MACIGIGRGHGNDWTFGKSYPAGGCFEEKRWESFTPSQPFPWFTFPPGKEQAKFLPKGKNLVLFREGTIVDRPEDRLTKLAVYGNKNFPVFDRWNNAAYRGCGENASDLEKDPTEMCMESVKYGVDNKMKFEEYLVFLISHG